MYLFLTILGINSDHFTNGINRFGALSMPQEINHRTLTSEDRVLSQVSTRGICSAISDTEIGLSLTPLPLRLFRFTIPPLSRTHFIH